MLEITLYTVPQVQMPNQLFGASDEAKYENLVTTIRKHGNMVYELRLRTEALIHALETIDAEIGNTGFLPVLAFNNSPNNVLGDDSDCPALGYFNPAQANDLFLSLSGLPASVMENVIKKGGYVLNEVFHAFYTASRQASQTKQALAVIHE